MWKVLVGKAMLRIVSHYLDTIEDGKILKKFLQEMFIFSALNVVS